MIGTLLLSGPTVVQVQVQEPLALVLVRRITYVRSVLGPTCQAKAFLVCRAWFVEGKRTPPALSGLLWRLWPSLALSGPR